jgi:hypothetical protein
MFSIRSHCRCQPVNPPIRSNPPSHSRIAASRTRVARWFVFKPKILICEKNQGLRLEKVDIFYGHWEYFNEYLGYFMTIWYILCSFGTFFRFWYHTPRKIWQPCQGPLLIKNNSSAIFKVDLRGRFFVLVSARVARWFSFVPKIQIWVYFGRPWNGKSWYILWPFWIFNGRFGIYYDNLA